MSRLKNEKNGFFFDFLEADPTPRGGRVRRNGREEKLYRAFGPLPLLGLFAAAKLLVRRDEANLRRYGHQIGSITPPIYEKGENA